MASPARLRIVMLAVVAVLGALLVAPAPAATAANALRADKKIVTGGITCPPKQSKCPPLKLMWFDKKWNYIGEKKLGRSARGYSINLEPGVYRLQLTDLRPAYDVKKYAPTDALVTVRADKVYTERNFTMRKGGAITGTARDGRGRPLSGAKIVAANTGRQSFPTTANSQGQFAIGGLPQGRYSVFTYDRKKVWVDKSHWAGTVKPGKAKNLKIKLRKKAGELNVYLTIPGAETLKKKTTLTVTSKKTGQWWSVTSGSGNFIFKGLYPGAYTAQFNGAGVWFAKTGKVIGSNVRPNGFDRGEFKLTKRGGWVTGVVLDGGGTDGPTDFAMEGARVGLYDSSGRELATSVTNANGRFNLQGPLATQDNLTITVDPGSNGGGWMRAAAPDNWCLFEGGEAVDASVRTGRETFYGIVYLPRSTESAQSTNCLS